jgi:hypothetical protein
MFAAELSQSKTLHSMETAHSAGTVEAARAEVAVEEVAAFPGLDRAKSQIHMEKRGEEGEVLQAAAV